MTDQKKILVIGATGYIGGYLIHELSRCGWVPVALDSGRNGTSRLEGLETRTMGEPDLLRGIGVVCHLAGMKGVDPCADRVGDAIAANLTLTERLLDKAAQRGIPFILMSTYWVYGHRAPLPYREDMVLTPSEPYGWTKALSEKLVAASGLDYTIVRLGNVFGYGMGHGYEEVVSLFLRRALAGGTLTLQNGGRHCVDLVSIDDVCRVMLSLLEAPHRKIVVNVGSGVPVSIGRIAEAANRVSEKLSGKRAEIDESFEKKDEILFADRWVDIGRLRGLTGFSPAPLESSLEHFAKQLCSGEKI